VARAGVHTDGEVLNPDLYLDDRLVISQGKAVIENISVMRLP